MKILFEDDNIIVCHKPSGMPTQTADIRKKDLMDELKNHIRINTDGKVKSELSLINRLDQPVEGIVLVAKNTAAAAKLSEQLTAHKMKKCYLAVVEDVEALDACIGEIRLCDYMVTDKKNNISKISNKNDKNAKKAELIFRVLQRKEGRALIRVELITGRHHQIRLQMANAGFPLIGDQKYGNNTSEKAVALCAYQLTFRNPKTGKDTTYEITPSLPSFHIFKDL